MNNVITSSKLSSGYYEYNTQGAEGLVVPKPAGAGELLTLRVQVVLLQHVRLSCTHLPDHKVVFYCNTVEDNAKCTTYNISFSKIQLENVYVSR